jgi:Pvc16 N-terminal domain
MDVPNQLRPGETGSPPLALNLYYMLTVFGGDDDESKSHRLLGRAMSILHDHPLLGREEIQLIRPESLLHAQVERVRVTLQPLSLDDIFKIWSTCQTPYRVSVAYEVAVILIDSTLSKTTPLPVLTQGPSDRGPQAQSNLIPPFPAIETVVSNPLVPALAAVLTFTGHDLSGANVVARFRTPALTDPIDVPVTAGGSDTQVTVTIPNANPELWPPGFYTVALTFEPGSRTERSTNSLPLTLAPQITFASSSVTIVPGAAGEDNSITVDVTIAPPIHAGQRVALLFRDREIPAPPRTGNPVDTLSFTIFRVAAGEYLVRLRVDGADSPIIAPTTPPTFLDSSRLKVVAP